MGYLIPARDTHIGLGQAGRVVGKSSASLGPIVPICLCPENKSVYVQKIKAYVQKIKAFVSSLHMMEFVIYKEILKSGKPTSGIFLVTFYAVS